jgi:8-oxo-dGTP pyrophosphatase MutT (NUDIX family)
VKGLLGCNFIALICSRYSAICCSISVLLNMSQKYRIYINEKLILLTESLPKNVQNYEKIDYEVFDLKILYTWALARKGNLFYVLCPDTKEKLKEAIKSVPLIEAAGGLVQNERNEFLFIFRNNKWDLPKGKVEKKEKIKIAAVREVEEECGIKVSSREDKICNTFHVYPYKGEIVLKKTYWFDMRSKSQDKLIPQTEEGITDARWFKKNDVTEIVANTFPSILDVLKKKKFFKEIKENLV